ncbi:MAG: peptidoglycan-binding protein [Erysipelotrichaceae bacterium]|nr:peptidoglycan-binding protein [Erysipelotrichaceae bacterium]
MVVLVYNEVSGQMEKYKRDCHENMPYTTDGVLTVDSFRAKSNTRLLWSTKRFLESVNESFHHLNVPFEVEHGFSRVWERFENEHFAHKLGTAIAGGENLNSRRKQQLLKELEMQEDYTYLQDFDHAPSIIHFHQSFDPVSDLIVFQKVQRGSVGVSVCALQDALWFLGYEISSINGIFDAQLERELRSFQRSSGLDVDGISGNQTWTYLMQILDPEEIRYKV